MKTPQYLSGLTTTFGELEIVGGKLIKEWEQKHLALFDFPYSLYLSWDTTKTVKRIYCHKKIGGIFQEVFQCIKDEGLASYAREYGGCFNFRRIRGTGRRKWSTHSWGIAIDLNPSSNSLGGPNTQSREIVEIFSYYGFVWGGNFKRKDGMHFQFVRGY